MGTDDFYEIPDIKFQRPVCGIEKKSEGYDLVNHEGTVIWHGDSKGENITSALSERSKRYYSDNHGFPKQRIWIIGTKGEKDFAWMYKNVASCCSESFNGEINEHIKQLIKEGQTQKAKRYFQLWNGSIRIAFFEILIDEYIEALKSLKSQDKYLSSIIFPPKETQDSNICEILNKIRMSFIEGEIAAKYNMKYEEKKGIWFPSGSGIDGDVYQYFKSKNPNCNKEN